MALPTLTTTSDTTSTSSSSTKATTVVKTSISSDKSTTITKSSKVTSFPSISTTASTSSYTTPAITVPPSSNNPYISRTSSPSGTVFICFGAILLFLLLVTFIAYYFNSWRAKRILLNKEVNYDTEYKGGYNYIPGEQKLGYNNNNNVNNYNTHNGNNRSTHSIALLSSNDSPTLTPMAPHFNNTQLTPQNASPYHHLHKPTDVTRMFISPTLEVLNVRNSTMFYNDPAAAGGNNSIATNSPLRTPVLTNFDSQTSLNHYQHSRDSSVVGSSVRESSTLRLERGRKNKSVIPSMFLDDMLEDDD